MGGTRDDGVRGGLAQLARRFAAWRQGHAFGARIPEPLWDAAAALAVEHGISRTATTLKLGYYDLKKRVDRKGSIPAFVELSPPMLSAPSVCTIELEKRDGSRMRIELKGASPADLAAVSRSFWESP